VAFKNLSSFKKLVLLLGLLGLASPPFMTPQKTFAGGCGFLDITCDPTKWESPTETIRQPIKKVFGRCGVPGEATINVRNNLRVRVIVLLDKASLGSAEQELGPGQSFNAPICNSEGFRVKIFTPQNCGRTFLGESRFSRVYNQEIVSINPGGITFQMGDFLDVAGRGAGFALIYIAQGYGVPIQALEAMGVREAGVVNACSNGSFACARAIYNWLPSDLLSTVKSDRCLSAAFTPISSVAPQPAPAPPPQQRPFTPQPAPAPPQATLPPPGRLIYSISGIDNTTGTLDSISFTYQGNGVWTEEIKKIGQNGIWSQPMIIQYNEVSRDSNAGVVYLGCPYCAPLMLSDSGAYFFYNNMWIRLQYLSQRWFSGRP
jgi:hypothetical protein